MGWGADAKCESVLMDWTEYPLDCHDYYSTAAVLKKEEEEKKRKEEKKEM